MVPITAVPGLCPRGGDGGRLKAKLFATPVSMPGRMKTILSIGVCDAAEHGLAKLYPVRPTSWSWTA